MNKKIKCSYCKKFTGTKRYVCNPCGNERQKAHRLKHLEFYRARHRKHYAENKDEMRRKARVQNAKLKLATFTAYCKGQPRCACCGVIEIDFLCLDHINGGGGKQRKEVGSGTAFYQWLKARGYPKVGLRVLCHNCNHSRRLHEGKCLHEISPNSR